LRCIKHFLTPTQSDTSTLSLRANRGRSVTVLRNHWGEPSSLIACRSATLPGGTAGIGIKK
jgi:hypothetical protein